MQGNVATERASSAAVRFKESLYHLNECLRTIFKQI